MAEPENGKPTKPKKTYTTPVLTVHGTVRDLTQTLHPHSSADGGPPMHHTGV